MSKRTKKYTDEEWDIKLKEIINMSKQNNNILPSNKDIANYVVGINALTDYLKSKGYKDCMEYFKQFGIHRETDLKLKDRYIDMYGITLEDVYELADIFKLQYGRVFTMQDCRQKYNLPSWISITNAINTSGITLQEFFIKIGRADIPRSRLKDYDKYVEIFKRESNKLGRSLTSTEVDKHILLPSGAWLARNCKDKNVKKFNDFVVWCGFKPYINIPKEMAIEIIFKMQSKLDRPISAHDFKNPKEDEIGIRTIYKIWGDVRSMQEELGLKITGIPSNRRTLEECKVDISMVCNTIKDKYDRIVITYTDIKSFKFLLDPSSYSKVFKRHGEDMREFISSIGFKLQKEGCGLNHTYEDGEKIKSQYELTFSNFLKDDLNLTYNKDYLRDIKYKEFAECDKKLDCDYVINYKGRKIYVEIVGMLQQYHDTWRTHEFTSKRKIDYVRKLKLKEQMFKENNLDYYIIFPRDCNEDFFMSIFDDKNIK